MNDDGMFFAVLYLLLAFAIFMGVLFLVGWLFNLGAGGMFIAIPVVGIALYVAVLLLLAK